MNTEQKKYIEIATTDFESTRQAVEGGADRIELCANLGEGGTTQSYGVIKKCREHFQVKIYPIIRVRGGDFLYTDDEFECMLEDINICRQLGCDGVVVGFLDMYGNIDLEKTRRVVEAAQPMGVTFHRAFDRCRNPLEALEQLIEAGCERILTSGQQKTAPEAVDLISKLNSQADARIVIMPGSGVRASNIRQLADATGCHEFHSSLRSLVASRMEFFPPAFAGDKENDHYSVEASAVKELRRAIGI